MWEALQILTLSCLILLAYHYLGYLGLLWLGSRLFPHPVAARSIDMPVSLIISAFNEEGVIEEKLRDALQTDYSNLEIVVVTDGSDDATLRLVKGFGDQGVRCLHQPERRGKAAAMNRAAAEANGEILLFSDANAFYRPDAVGRIVANFADPNVGCVSGKKTVRRKTADGSWSSVGEAEGVYWRYEAAIKRFESAIASTAGVVGEMLAVRRSSWRPIPAGVINDDFYICLAIQKLGKRVIYAHDAISWELPSQSLGDDLKRRQRITAGRFQALFNPGWWPWNKPLGLFMLVSHKLLRLLLPALFVLALVANLALLAGPALPNLLMLTLWAQLAFYGLVVAGSVGYRLDRRWRLPSICYYIFAGNVGTVRGFMHFLSEEQGVLWEKAAR